MTLSQADLVENGYLKLRACTGADGEIRLNERLGNASIANCKDQKPIAMEWEARKDFDKYKSFASLS